VVKTRKVTAVGDYVMLQPAGQALGLSYWEVYGLVRRGQVEALKLGRTYLVRLSDLEKAGQDARAIRA
jgi:excisionase family DNA binding protein